MEESKISVPISLLLCYVSTCDLVSSDVLLFRSLSQTVDVSFKFDLPPHLIIKSSNIKLTETIGQGVIIIMV